LQANSFSWSRFPSHSIVGLRAHRVAHSRSAHVQSNRSLIELRRRNSSRFRWKKNFSSRRHLGETGPLSQGGLKRVGRHSEYTI
jgi:hypothetical protein